MSQDASLTCMDCGRAFLFSARAQDYYREHNYGTPVRCVSCRAKRKQERGEEERELARVAAGEAALLPAPTPVLLPAPPHGNASPARLGQMWDVVCSGCHLPAQVPFQPKSDRPVYCRACYLAGKAAKSTR